MYLGQITQTIRQYGRKYVVGIGDMPSLGKVVDQTLEHYRCDHCHADAKVLGKAMERFYCGHCGQLIAIAEVSHD